MVIAVAFYLMELKTPTCMIIQTHRNRVHYTPNFRRTPYDISIFYCEVTKCEYFRSKLYLPKLLTPIEFNYLFHDTMIFFHFYTKVGGAI